ncbi:hypothetical protein GUJ93_ZPchr0003g17239 [Zizania palustris]|uniref:Cytochrome P450 n=1 Tax=Zizania palustris TaxID=103762 RepID=A0A8J5SWD4_ZIZPA|nr:hypothetical protein GUJ93_ZPchr0003g17239 [Zizania palustris]
MATAASWLALLVSAAAVAAAWVWGWYAWRLRAVARRFAARGVRGPRYEFLRGCNEEVRRMKAAAAAAAELGVRDHDYLRRIMPHFVAWKDLYGGTFLFWNGPQPRICISDYEMVKKILLNKYGHFVKNDAHPTILAMIGKGLVLVEGAEWVRHHRVVSPAFAMDKLKMMTKTMVSCAECFIKEWQYQACNSKSIEIEVEFNKQFQELTADVICHTAFGSSYKEGKEVFHAQKQLQANLMATILNVQLPGFKYLPTKGNRCKWMLEKKMKNTLMQIIQSRLASKGNGYGDDLLGVMLDACFTTEQGQKQDEQILSMDEIIHECKTFFFVGHETTSHLLTWTMFLLSVYPEWQERLRQEVMRECGKENPNADKLIELKEMTMVLLETLRLYTPVIFMFRKPITDMNLPRGTPVVIPIPMLHRDKEVWGDDANEFNPLRFQNGVTKAAKIPHAFLGFSVGPRSCIGQNFAMLEAKSAIAMILQRFSFTLSPNYVHAPADQLTLQPKFGLPILVRPLDA